MTDVVFSDSQKTVIHTHKKFSGYRVVLYVSRMMSFALDSLLILDISPVTPALLSGSRARSHPHFLVVTRHHKLRQ